MYRYLKLGESPGHWFACDDHGGATHWSILATVRKNPADGLWHASAVEERWKAPQTGKTRDEAVRAALAPVA